MKPLNCTTQNYNTKLYIQKLYIQQSQFIVK